MAAAILIVLLAVTSVDGSVRIVPLGDSLTKGMLDTDDGKMHPTYRYWLHTRLKSNGYDVDFVGSWAVPDFPVSFDKGNEGHGGYTIAGIVDGVKDEYGVVRGGKLSTWLAGYYPDIALVLIGTNDVLANRPMDTRFSDLSRLVDALRARNPRIRVFVAKLPPTGDSFRNTNSGLITFNTRLPGWASGKTTSTSPITIVDLYSGYDGRLDNQAPRYIHPDESGEKKISDDWYAAIAPYLTTVTPGTTPPTPTPTPTPNQFAITGPREITSPGTYYLTNNILNGNDPTYIEVLSPGVTIDGRGYRLGGTGNAAYCGIFVNGIPDVTIKNLKVSGWGYGIRYEGTGVGIGRIEGCTIENNHFAGIVLYRGVTGVSVVGNRITNNAPNGIWISDANGNVVFNNLISNAESNVQVVGSSTGNNFSVTDRPGPNIIGGPSIGGNYWSNPAKTGFSDRNADGNGDGFSDVPYSFAGQIDERPLTSLVAPGPYRTLAIPGTIEAEDYDNGGEGVAYHDTTAGNSGGAYRSNDVDIESVPGGYALAYIRDTEWTQYTVTVQEAGDYRIDLLAAAWIAPRTVRISAGGAEVGSITIPVTGSPSTFSTAGTTVRLAAGTQTIRLAFTGDGMNLDRITAARVTQTATPTPTPTAVPQAPYPAPHELPTMVEAEHFDTGGEGVAYHDAEPVNLGYDQTTRPGEGVDLETSGGVTDVCFVRPGELLNFSVDAPGPGSHTLVVRAANPDPATKAVTVYLDGALAGDIPVASTGGWTAYQDFAGPAPIPFTTGRHVVTLAFEGVERLNLDRLDFTPVGPSPTPTATPTANVTETILPTPVPTETITPMPTPTANETPADRVLPVAGEAAAPTDPGGDGVYDDVNGNGRADFADLVLYFNQMTWIAENEPISAFDCNRNGRIDFADVVWLFDRL